MISSTVAVVGQASNRLVVAWFGWRWTTMGRNSFESIFQMPYTLDPWTPPTSQNRKSKQPKFTSCTTRTRSSSPVIATGTIRPLPFPNTKVWVRLNPLLSNAPLGISHRRRRRQETPHLKKPKKYAPFPHRAPSSLPCLVTAASRKHPNPLVFVFSILINRSLWPNYHRESLPLSPLRYTRNGLERTRRRKNDDRLCRRVHGIADYYAPGHDRGGSRIGPR
jgi:hypothetical protein